jgi:hypothetical protein
VGFSGAGTGALPGDIPSLLPLRASFRPLPALNFGTMTGGIWIFSVGLCGLTPTRPARVLALNAPNPAIFTSPPFCRVVVTMSTRVAIISSTSFFEAPTFSEMACANAALFIFAYIMIN